MGITDKLIDKALELAGNFFDSVRDGTGTTTVGASIDHIQLINAIDVVAVQIDRLASDIESKIAGMMERAQLEKLSAQAKGVKQALEFDNETMLGMAIVHLSEQTEYSAKRLTEGKYEWLGPWIVAESIRIEGLRILTKNERAATALRSESQKFRVNILNFVGKLLVQSHPSPWQLISDFIEGRNDDLLIAIREIPLMLHTSEKSKLQLEVTAGKSSVKDTIVDAPSSKTVLAPAIAWPFPTSTRPS